MRYFYFSFKAVVKGTTNEISGHFGLPCPSFPNMLMLAERIIPEYCGNKVDQVVLNNLFEFKDQVDYEDFVAGYDFLAQTNELLGL